jgi:putative transposase
MQAVSESMPPGTAADACRAFGVPRASWYRHERPVPVAYGPKKRRASPRRSLSETERETVLETVNSQRFADQAPGEIVATLLDEGRYLCSERTMYRILKDHDQVRERRRFLRHPTYQRPELLATRPNEVWTWDITKLKGPVKYQYFQLYVMLDIFSRMVVGWMLADCEKDELAGQLIAETCERQGILPDQLSIHADRGTSMTSLHVAALLANLGVTKSHSRPHVSNDNPYSESHFKTMKYRPNFPARFGSLVDARAFCRAFFDWYNHDHHHSGIAMLTPADHHRGLGDAVLIARNGVMLGAYGQNPERFVNGKPVVRATPDAAWINPPMVVRVVADPS